VTFRCWNFPLVGQLLVDEPRGLAIPGVHRSSRVARRLLWREERPDLPVSLLMVLHALRLECEKAMELTASSHRSFFFLPSQDSRNEVALSESVPTGARVKERYKVLNSFPSMAHGSSDGYVGCIAWPRIVGSRKNPGMPSQCLMCSEVAISQRIHL